MTHQPRDSVVFALHFFNWVDGVATLSAVSLFGVEELNPLMDLALQNGAAFYLVKFVLIAGSVEFLHRYLPGRSRAVLVALLGLVTAVCAWHLLGFIAIGRA